jgi:hypothetical protein
MSKTLALDFGRVLRTTSALVALGFFPAVLPAQQVLAGGANLFAPSPHVGRELDAARALPVTSFYATEGLKANADPGTLVGSEPATEYALPPGVAAVRILYHTGTAGNVDAVASAVVLVPDGQAPPGGWSLLAWSHRTSGVARECAPSRMKSLFWVPARPVGLDRCPVCWRAATRQLFGAIGFPGSIWPRNKRGPSTVAEVLAR